MIYVSTAKNLHAQLLGWKNCQTVFNTWNIVIVYSLGICAELERLMDDIVANYKCEWGKVVYDKSCRRGASRCGAQVRAGANWEHGSWNSVPQYHNSETIGIVEDSLQHKVYRRF